MEFIKNLIDTIDSAKIKGFESPFGTYEDMGFRMLKQIKISDDIGLSVQASYGHYCTPRKTLPLKEYSTMELAIFKDGEFVNVNQVTKNENIIDKLNECYEGTVYGCVPVEMLEELYQELIITA